MVDVQQRGDRGGADRHRPQRLHLHRRGPGGLKPDLHLVYSSQGSHWSQRSNAISGANYGKGLQSASWLGEGFDIPLGYVQKTTDVQNNDHYSASLFSQGFRLLKDSQGSWHTADEQFWKIDGAGTDNSLAHPVSYQWRVVTPDGTKYFFGIAADQSDLMVYWDFLKVSQFANRWLLSRVVDPSGNLITISYARLTKPVACASPSGTMTPAVYPTRIQYGGQDPSNLPYSIVFNRSGTPPTPLNGSGIDRADVNVPDWITDGCTQLPFDTNALANLEVQVSGQVARRYVFTVNHSSVPMLLQKVDLWSDANGTLVQPLLAMSYTDPPLQDTDTPVNAGAGPNVTGSYRLLASVTNGFGGSTSFGYQFEGVANDAAYEGPSTNLVLYNGRAVVVASRTVNPGFGAALQTTTYPAYRGAQGNGDSNWPDFQGHNQVNVVDAASASVYAYLQGQSSGRVTDLTISDTASPPNLLREEVSAWDATHLDPNAAGITWTSLNNKGVYQQAGAQRTSYLYSTTTQNGGQYAMSPTYSITTWRSAVRSGYGTRCAGSCRGWIVITMS